MILYNNRIMIHYSEELLEKLRKTRKVVVEARVNELGPSDLSFDSPGMKDGYADKADPRNRSVLKDAMDEIKRQKARDTIIKEVISRGLLDGANESISTEKIGAWPATQMNPNQWEIKVDKTKWKMSIPKEKETEDSFSIVFDRKQ